MKNIKKIFIGGIVISIVVFAYSGLIGIQQVSQRKDDYAVYDEVRSSIENIVNLEEALKNIEKLQNKYNDSYVFNIDKGFIYKSLNKPNESFEEFKNAFEKNKGLYKNVNLLIIYSEVAQQSGNIKESKEAISRAKKLGIPKEQKQRVSDLLAKI